MTFNPTALKTSQIFDPVSCAEGVAVQYEIVSETPVVFNAIVTNYSPSVLTLTYRQGFKMETAKVQLMDVLSGNVNIEPLYTYSTIVDNVLGDEENEEPTVTE